MSPFDDQSDAPWSTTRSKPVPPVCTTNESLLEEVRAARQAGIVCIVDGGHADIGPEHGRAKAPSLGERHAHRREQRLFTRSGFIPPTLPRRMKIKLPKTWLGKPSPNGLVHSGRLARQAK